MSQPAPSSTVSTVSTVRRYLGSAHTLSERVRVYWAEKALEVDRLESYEIRRSRVFFDEVLLVTLSSKRGGVLPWVTFGFAALAWFISVLVQSEPAASQALTWVALGLLAIGAVLFLTPLWVVTVFGRRTRARMQFRLGERKARDLFAQICQAADEAQRALHAAEPARDTEPPQPPPLPLSEMDGPPP
jgi:hypothetical protein